MTPKRFFVWKLEQIRKLVIMSSIGESVYRNWIFYLLQQIDEKLENIILDHLQLFDELFHFFIAINLFIPLMD